MWAYSTVSLLHYNYCKSEQQPCRPAGRGAPFRSVPRVSCGHHHVHDALPSDARLLQLCGPVPELQLAWSAEISKPQPAPPNTLKRSVQA